MGHLTCHVFGPGSAIVIAGVANLAGKGLGVKFPGYRLMHWPGTSWAGTFFKTAVHLDPTC